MGQFEFFSNLGRFPGVPPGFSPESLGGPFSPSSRLTLFSLSKTFDSPFFLGGCYIEHMETGLTLLIPALLVVAGLARFVVYLDRRDHRIPGYESALQQAERRLNERKKAAEMHK